MSQRLRPGRVGGRVGPLLVGGVLLAGCGAGTPLDGSAGPASGTPTEADFTPVACQAATSAPTRPGVPGTPAEALPDVALACLGGDGSTAALRALVTRPTVVALWASWCAPCIDELPVLDELAAADDVAVLGVVTEDTASSASGLAAALRLGFPSVLDPRGQVRRSVGVPGLPATLLVRSDGSVAHVAAGPPLTRQSLADLVDTYLGDPT